VKGTDVRVTGTLTAKLAGNVGMSATVYNSGGNKIGSGSGPVNQILNSGQSLPFQFTVIVNGTPTSCNLNWVIGPTPAEVGGGFGG
jgi:hypothetical protein